MASITCFIWAKFKFSILFWNVLLNDEKCFQSVQQTSSYQSMLVHSLYYIVLHIFTKYITLALIKNKTWPVRRYCPGHRMVHAINRCGTHRCICPGQDWRNLRQWRRQISSIPILLWCKYWIISNVITCKTNVFMSFLLMCITLLYVHVQWNIPCLDPFNQITRINSNF